MHKLNSTIMVLLLLTTILVTDVFAQRGRGRQGNQPDQVAGANQLTDEQRESLIQMREEEKLARDVYLAMQSKWGERVFTNISAAESRHMSAVGNLLSRYGIPDPVVDDTPGMFVSEKFQDLYQSLVTSGSKSLAEALKAALKIEEMDIVDLRSAIQANSQPDIQRVFENLERGSRNHLRAFASRLKSFGGLYEATDLSQQEFDRIASSPQESGSRAVGPRDGNGRGKRRGKQHQKGRGKNNGR